MVSFINKIYTCFFFFLHQRCCIVIDESCPHFDESIFICTICNTFNCVKCCLNFFFFNHSKVLEIGVARLLTIYVIFRSPYRELTRCCNWRKWLIRESTHKCHFHLVKKEINKFIIIMFTKVNIENKKYVIKTIWIRQDGL